MSVNVWPWGDGQKREAIRTAAQASRVRRARWLAEESLRDPYKHHGRGSTLEAELAQTILALLEMGTKLP